MALPADFSKIYGSAATGGLTPISDVNYAKGWEFVGSNPPTKNDSSYLQNLSDLKSQWLYNNKLQRTDPFGDIKSDGAVKTALENLGLGEGSALPVGVPIPWPSAIQPDGWLKCNGAAFTASQYPKLAQAYPALRLPDLRGEFIRGWDDGRGVDSGRTLLSWQKGTLVGGIDDNYYGIDISCMSNGAIIDYGGDKIPSGDYVDTYLWYVSLGSVSRTQAAPNDHFFNVTRPRNVAFNYIVRAA